MNMRKAAYNVARSSSGKMMNLKGKPVQGFVWLLLVGLAGCGSTPETKPSKHAAASKPAEPAIPPEIQAAADGSLGSETAVLAYGHLAKTGAQQALIANVVPKTPKENITGTIVSRAAIIENQNG